MSKFFFLAVAAAAAVALTGCQTQLQAREDGEGTFTPRMRGPALVGVDYGVPMLQFQIKVQRMLVDCGTDTAPGIRFLSKVTAAPHYVVGERFTIDYDTLSAWSKVSKFELQTYDSGVLKSLNAEAEDQTRAILADAVKSGISLLSLSGAVLPANKSLLPGQTELAAGYQCSPNTKSALSATKTTTRDLKAATEKLVGLSDEVARLERLAGMNALTPEQKRRLDAAQKETIAQAKTVSATDEALADLVKRVSVDETITWPTRVDELELNAAPNASSRQFLFALFVPAPGGSTLAQLEGAMALRGRLAPAIEAATSHEDKSSQYVSTRRQAQPGKGEGLLYRSPVAARLLICEKGDAAACNLKAASGVVVSVGVRAPQLGPLRVLPFTNGIFQSNVLKVAFREDGSVSTLNYDERVARGKELSGSVASALDEVVAFRDARQASRDKKSADLKAQNEAKKQAALDELDAEISRLEKLKKIGNLNAQTSQDASLSDIQTETARLNAQIALLEAHKKVRDAEASLATP